MGILEDIDRMDLADDVKASLRESALAEIRERTRESRRATVESEVQAIAAMFSDKEGNVDPQATGLLKYARRVLLSDDEEPGLVLLTDDELQLADDQRTGARSREEVTAAGVLREFISLIPKTEEGKISLSDLVPDNNDDDRPDDGNDSPEQKSAAARERLGKITGHTAPRTRKRYQGGLAAVGGDA